jgi:phospholipid transport system substrate-binding protein
MLPSSTPMNSRRGFLTLMSGAATVALLPVRPAHAMTAAGAQSLIEQAIAQVYQVINSGLPAAQMYRDFESILESYADVDIIARTVLGPTARQIDSQQFAAYRQALRGYIGRKYGKRFREFIGSKVEVTGARPLKSFFAVSSVARLNGRAPMEVEWHVSDKSGQPRFFNLIIEGVNMIASERAEVAAMLARRKGDVAALTADLQQSG